MKDSLSEIWNKNYTLTTSSEEVSLRYLEYKIYTYDQRWRSGSQKFLESKLLIYDPRWSVSHKVGV